MKDSARLRPWAVFLWLVIWQISAMLLGESLLLPSPVTVLLTLLKMLFDVSFLKAVAFSGGRILLGAIIGTLLASFSAIVSSRFSVVRELLLPIVSVIKSVPVASFIILILVWLNSRSLTVAIVVLMIFPVIYQNVLMGILSVDKTLIEMATIFDVSLSKKLVGIYIPWVLPYFRTALSLGLGLSFKAGTAAEVIGIPDGSLGEKLYMAKVYLMTPELFAITLAIIILSYIIEKILLCLTDIVIRKAGIKEKT